VIQITTLLALLFPFGVLGIAFRVYIICIVVIRPVSHLDVLLGISPFDRLAH
jgi:hypothetical protein